MRGPGTDGDPLVRAGKQQSARLGPVSRLCPACPPRMSAVRVVVTSWERVGTHSLGVFIWEPAYFLIGLGVNEWIRSVCSERGWALERVI